MALPVLTGATLCLDANTGVTADASNRVSAWADRYAVINNFTQSTDANKPLLSRDDNKENIVLYSEDLSNAAWIAERVTKNSNVANNPLDATLTADSIVEDTGTGTHGIYQNIPNIVSGQTYRFSVYAKEIGTIRRLRMLLSIRFTNANVQWKDGVEQVAGAGASNKTVENLGSGWYRYSFDATATGTGTAELQLYMITTGGTSSYTGDGVSGYQIYGAQIQRTSTDSTYQATTTFPQYAGVNGNQTLVFNGSQRLASTSLLSAIVTNAAKLYYITFRPFLTSSTQILMEDNGGYSINYIDSGGTIRFQNDDGSADNVRTSSITANTLYVLRTRHDAGNIFISIDTGNGFSAETGVATTASGNTTLMTGAIGIGQRNGGTLGLYGQILNIQADNVGTPDTTFETELRSALFGTTTESTTNLFFCYPQLPIQSTVTADNPFTGFNKAEDIGAGDRADHYRTNTERTTTNISYDLGSGVLDKPEYFIVARADYLSRGDSGTPTITLRGSVNSGYTATEDLSISVNSSTLVGLRNEDVILETSFGASYRYFRLTLSTTSSFYHEISKIYFGDFFDLGRDPLYLSEFKLLKKQQDNKKHKRVYNLIYDGITEAKREAFNETILKNADIYPIYLYDKNDLFFEGKKLLHCWITDHKWDIGYFKSKLTLELTEVF